MMLLHPSLNATNLPETLTQLQNQVRKDPANASLRVFLFQLLAVLGEWERALTQLKIAGDLDAANLAMVQTYREAIRCEVLRKEIFSGHKSPLVFGNPEQWIALLLEALKLSAAKQHSQAHDLRNQAFALAPATSGIIDGQAFEWIADADVRLGPMLEVIVNGHYYWIPFHQISLIQFDKPTDLRDMVWTAAHFKWINGGEAYGLIPTRYPGSETAGDPALRLARRTEWQDEGDNLFTGKGQRLLTTNENDHALLDIREIAFNPI